MGFKASNKKEKEKSIYNVNDLSKLGYLYDNNGAYVPYPNKENPTYYLGISRTKTKKSEIVYSWVKKNKNKFTTLTVHKSDKLISQEDAKLTDNLCIAMKNAGIEENDTLDEFIENFHQNIIQSSTLEVLKDPDFKFPDLPEEKKESKEEPEPQIKPFKAYPKLIKKEALKIINEGRLFEELINSISLTHEGHIDLKKQLILILASVFVDAPVHTELNADTGVGKTDIIAETSKNFPKDYVHVLRTVSPKNIYYDRESYGEYNIVVFDDVVLNDSIIEVIKELADNKKAVKELKTVTEGKSETYTLPGKFLVILTYAKANPDEELLNRLYKLNIIITKKDEKSNIKHTIKDNALINADNNQLIDRTRNIMQAAIQYLIEQNIQVFNPFVTLFDPTNFSNRNIKAFVSLVKSRSFFHTSDLKDVEIMGQKIYIGSYKDYEEVVGMWADSSEVQRYKLNSSQVQILNLLPEMTPDEAYNYNKDILNDIASADSITEREDFRKKLFTRKNIAKAIGVNDNTIVNHLDNSKGTAKSLFDYGLIDRLKLEEDKDKSAWTYYRIKDKIDLEKDETVKEALRHQRQIDNEYDFDTLYYKIKSILSFLLLSNISINKVGYEYLENYCKKYSDSIKLDDYDSYYNFIKKAIDNFDVEKYAIKLDKATYSDLAYISKKWAALKKLEGFEETPSKDSHEIFDEANKKESNNLDDETGEKSTVISEMQMMIKEINPHEIFNSDINQPDFALKVCKLLFGRILTENELFDEIYGDCSSYEEECYCSLELDNILQNLKINDCISYEKNEDGKYQYHLNDDISDKLKPFMENSNTVKKEHEDIHQPTKELNLDIISLEVSEKECREMVCEILSKNSFDKSQLYNAIFPSDDSFTEDDVRIRMKMLTRVLHELDSSGIISCDEYDYCQMINMPKELEKASILKKDLSADECQFRICGVLANQDMCEEDIDQELAKITSMSRISRKSLLKKSISVLKSKGTINSREHDGKIYYYLDSEQFDIFENDLIQNDYGFRPFEL